MLEMSLLTAKNFEFDTYCYFIFQGGVLGVFRVFRDL